VNGVLIAGEYSSTKVHPKTLSKHFMSVDETVYYILHKAMHFNKNHIYFPIWMQGYGFDFVMQNISRKSGIFSPIKSQRFQTYLIPNDMEKTELPKLIRSNDAMINTFVSSIKKKDSYNIDNVKKTQNVSSL